MDAELRRIFDDLKKTVAELKRILDSIRLPGVWRFDLPVIFHTARWNRTSVFSVVASGTDYIMTATMATFNFGTTDPILTITEPGKYLIFGKCRLDGDGATFANERLVQLRIRRTNNTASTLQSANFNVPICTTSDETFSEGIFMPFIYETDRYDDILEMQGEVSIIPSAGNLVVETAEITAVRIV